MGSDLGGGGGLVWWGLVQGLWHYPPVNRMKNTGKNITFPKLRLWTVKIPYPMEKGTVLLLMNSKLSRCPPGVKMSSNEFIKVQAIPSIYSGTKVVCSGGRKTIE